MKSILPTLKQTLMAGALAIISQLSVASPLLSMHSPTTGNNYVAYTDLRTYAQAETNCKTKQGHLAVINTNAEANELKAYLHTFNGTYWLGETVAGYQGTYATVTGQYFYTPPAITETGYPYPGDTSTFYYQFITSDTGEVLNWTIATTAYYVCEFEDAPV